MAFKAVEPKSPEHQNSPWGRQILSLSLTSLFLHPLDRIQSILQLKDTYLDAQSPKSLKQLFKRIYIKQELSSLWRGAYQNIIRQFLQFNLAYFLSMSIYQNNGKQRGNGLEGYQMYLATSYVSGMITYPLEVVKNKYMVDMRDKYADKPYRSIGNCLKESYKVQRWRGVFGGFSVGLVQAGVVLGLLQPVAYVLNNISALPAYLSLPVSVLTLELLSYPLDTIKKRLQISGAPSHNHKYNTLKKAITTSPSQLFNGFTFRLLYLPLHLITFTFFLSYFNSTHSPLIIPLQIQTEYQSRFQ